MIVVEGECTMPVSAATYERLALEDPEGHWELVHGRPRRKPDMATEHNDVMRILRLELQRQKGLRPAVR